MIDSTETAALAKLVIITGMSGAGKTIAVQSLEDLGFFCVDNLPPVLIPKFAELIEQSKGKIGKVALVIDLRGREFFTALSESLNYIREHYTINCEILFLDATDEVLVQRYKESRRRHPLKPNGMPLEGIKMERKLLEDLKGWANQVIDTSSLKPAQLKERIVSRFTQADQNRMSVNVTSFGFKYGVPIDADLIFDVRFLPNPHYVEQLRPHTGQDIEVYDYVMKWPETQAFLSKLLDLLQFLLPQYRKEGKSQVVIGIGCTGGKHRSVAVAEYLGRTLGSSETEVVRVSHRDSERDRH
ncbi:RNase adapter RapZ [Paenibacillus melissococcoides]|uniref:RNase adapter RapZ n=1 Tax=Paenibacillus melissococcoides TaxID=2912268 RepID=A0ABN8UDE8_9BACL|nr:MULTISPECIES: RNase adapter RapZ [Paenibacillus]MEB9893850.1 RNase adapter RapZ [Bacillus cereus]MBG9794747.1 glmZ(sRNA)-inactivating NTPase [Paenibacillus dendritiformis]CAH8247509.1 RNase adapter RapZ [Paenibacillus melissococcoides]CAH8705199.1 RNase adapter RapZ [Paenibacillus melissococcoides]CAH8714611.1 RNase adapter RapZ [Paenibacillus melissococcoides]